MKVSGSDDLVVVSGVDPLTLNLFRCPNGCYPVQEAERRNLRLAFNLGFFEYDQDRGYSIKGLLSYRGEPINTSPTGYPWTYLFFVDDRGRPGLSSLDELSSEWWAGLHLGVEVGPRLVYDGECVSGLDREHKSSRLAIGWDGSELVLFAHRRKISLHEFAGMIRDIGTRFAINLDGGGSLSLYVRTTDGLVSVIGIPSNPEDTTRYEQGPLGRKVPYFVGVPDKSS